MTLGVRGGDTTTTNSAELMARGGSTATKKRSAKTSFSTLPYNGTVDVSSSVTIMKPVEPMEPETKELEGTDMVEISPEPQKEKFHKRIAKKLKCRNSTNLSRKVMHASWGLLFAALNHLIPKETFVPAMAVLSGATLLMELLRYRKNFGWMNKALHFVLGSALRQSEMDGKFTGSFYFFTGVTVTAALFPQSAATLGIIQLAIADPSASYFGSATRHVRWSRIQGELGGFGRNKGILGFLGGALMCVPFNYRILSLAKFGGNVPGGQAALVLASLALGMAGSLADLAVPTPAITLPKKICGVRVPPLHIDDNFVVPVVSGYACTQIFKALAWQQTLQLSQCIFA
ncbi:expressed unknown protein [Seminavis robusta]|uniref:Phosphatidate cytidylyltransferase n=1 Tax=Seminavis robusta TaxID=568900 RepID=A0A9N8F3X2_9STRA|nr:expressed unknown protein [Seminavis robusta]|eukprot:Sro2816_g337760.1 n/a (345) ;mRNA; r:6175-7518